MFVRFVAATPSSGSEIQTDESITVVFNGIPRGVVVTAGTAKTAGQTVTISGPFKAGPLKLRITWHNGGRFLNYTATAEKADLVAFVAATPPSGSAILTDESITVVFDGTPTNVAVTAGTAKTAGQTVTISGPFKAGPLKLRITWSDGAHVLNYTATAEKADLVAFVAATPPSGSAIQTDESITVVFDGTPANVAVTAGTAKTAGPTVTISGPFKAGPLNLTITWSDGAHVLNYTATAEKADLVAFVAATPPSGSEILTDASITVVFDGTPANVAVTAGTAKTAGPTVTISGPFEAGPLNLTITWSDGAHVLNYTVISPKADLVAFVAATPPSGSEILTDASITVFFDEIPGNVAATAGTAAYTAKTTGQKVTISGPFKAGPLNLTITWSDGAHVLNYTVIPVAFFDASPPSGSEIQTDESIRVFFDGIPGNVAVTAGTAKTAGQTVTISGPFEAGPLNLTITWSDGAHVLNYTVIPVAFVAASPPSGSEILTDASITVFFDGTPGNVAVTAGTAKTTGQTVTISGPFEVGPLNLTITWSDGAHVLNYVVAIPELERELPPPPAIGKPAIEFHVKDLDGGDLSLEKYRGKIILLDFWAVWCPPCRAETPHLKRAYEKFKNEGFEIIGISLDHDKVELLRYIKEEDITWPQFFDERWDVARPYRIAWIPHNFLIDHEGVIRKSGLRLGALEPAIAELIQERNAN